MYDFCQEFQLRIKLFLFTLILLQNSGGFNMKKKFAILVIMIFSLVMQPFSINVSAKDENKLSLNDCDCNKKEELKVKNTEKLNNNKVINNVKKSLREKEEFKSSLYKQSDFDWKNVEVIDFDKEKEGIMVPYKKNNATTDIRLLTAYDETTHEVTDFIIMKSVLKGEKIETSYLSLSNEEAVTLTIDVNTNKVVDLEIPSDKETESLITVKKASAGYTDKVVKCVKNYWKDASGITKTVCSSACTSIIFGGNGVGVAICASCLGAYAMVCLIQ